jgi:hypothetical protein
LPSKSLSQHRWIAWQDHDPEAREKSGLTKGQADEWLHADKGSPWKKHSKGIATHKTDSLTHEKRQNGGIAGSPEMEDVTQHEIGRYASLPVDRLRALSESLGDSARGTIVRQILAQKESLEKSIPKRDMGGPMTHSMGRFSQKQGVNQGVSTGFLSGDTLGRADSLTTNAPGGSYIIPADVVSGLGEGNSEAGARVWDEILRSGPWGVKSGRADGGRSPQAFPMAKPTTVPVMLSHGEIAVIPEDVLRIGNGNIKRGHQILDRWVIHERAKHIKKLKSLPGPVKPRSK